MKTFVVLALVIALALGIFACGKQEPEETTRVTLYLPDHDAIETGGYGFVKKTMELHMAKLVSLQAMELVSHLVYDGALPEGCDALHFYVSTSELDMNAAFAEALSRTGTLGETLLMGCLVNTMLEFFALDSITITAEGQVLQTGHEIYDYPLTFYGNQRSDLENAGEGGEA